jgi:hypothetical protein
VTTAQVHPTAAASWQLLVDRIAAEADPRCRANLEIVARHVDAEVRGDLDALMATLTASPVYRYLGATSSPGPVGADAVRAYYAKSVETGKNRLEFEIDNVVVDHETVVTCGIFRHAYVGAELRSRGGHDESTVPDLDAWYLVQYRALVVWPISAADGLITGEDVYIAEAPRVERQLSEDEAPQLGPVGRYRGPEG